MANLNLRGRQFGELDPVELDVLPRGEVAVTAVIAPRDMRERTQLLRRQGSVGDRHAEHIGVQLQIDAVLQPQHLEFVLGELAGQPSLHLIAKFRDTFVDDCAIEFVICIHQSWPYAGTGRSMVTPWSRICSRRLPGFIAPVSLTSTGAMYAPIAPTSSATDSVSSARASSEVRTIAASDSAADHPCREVR